MTDISVIYSDNDLVIANKPAGLTVIPDRIHTERETVQSILEKTFGKLWVVHRIDKFTSGVLCFARNEVAHRHLSLQFQNHEVQKFYKAVATGRMKEKTMTIDLPIAENMAHAGTMLVHKRGKNAITIYEIEEEFKHATLLPIEIKTGRTHQISVHLAYIGNPLLVDEIYAKAPAFYFSSIKKKYKSDEDIAERPTISRLTLHAYQVTFTHPTSLQKVTHIAPLPKDIETLLKLLRKYDK